MPRTVKVKGLNQPLEFPDEMDDFAVLRVLRDTFSKFVEPALAIGSGAIAEPVAGLAGLAQAANPFADKGAGAETVNQVKDALTYQPGTKAGKQGLKDFGQAVMNTPVIGDALETFEKAQNVAGEKTADQFGPAAGAFAKGAVGILPDLLGIKGYKSAKNVSKADLGTVRMFGGIGAKNADIPALNQAKELAKSGADRGKIWKETGWYDDAGDWKFEIDDSKSVFDIKDEVLRGKELDLDFALRQDKKGAAILSKSNDLEKGLISKYGDDYASNWDEIPEVESEKYFKSLNDIPEIISDLLWSIDDIKAGRVMNRDIKPNSTANLDDALLHNDLYAQYPDSRNIELQHNTSGLSPNEASYARNDRIKIGDPLYSKMKPTVLHETQHAIQQREGFSRGGSPDAASYFLKENKKQELDKLSGKRYQAQSALFDMGKYGEAEYLAKLDKISKSDNVRPSSVTGLSDWYEYSDQIRNKFGAMPKSKAKGQNQWLQSAAAFIKNKNMDNLDYYAKQLIQTAIDDPKKIRSEYSKAARKFKKLEPDFKEYKQTERKFENIEGLSDYEKYKRLAGEAEARNVEKRIDWTPEQRRNTPPWETLDVPENELIRRK